MKKILFITQSYPSVRSANVLCDEKIIRCLLENGSYEVHCLTYKNYKQYAYEKINGIYVYRIKRSLFWNVLMRTRANEDNLSSKLMNKANRIVLRLKQILTITIYPCYEPMVAKKIAGEAIRLHRKEQFDLVIAEHNGFDTLYAGAKLKKSFPEIKFIPILWDPFSGKQLAKYLTKKFAEKKMLNSENNLLSLADCIIAMKSSEAYHKEHSVGKSYFDKYVFLDIPNVIKPETYLKDSDLINKEKINIVFTGVLSLPERDPEYIVTLLNKSEYVSNFNLIFLCTGNGKNKLIELKDSFKGKMTISGYVPHSEIGSIYQNADVLLNLGGSNPYMVPSKIFEYMSYGKPIVSTYYIDEESSKRYFEKYPLAICIDTREDFYTNTKRLDMFLENTISKTMPFQEIEEIFSENTPEKYVEIIKQVLEK